MRYLLRTVLPLGLLLAGLFVVLRVSAGADALGLFTEMERPWLAAPAFAALLATVLFYVAVWRSLMLALDPARPQFIDTAAVFTCSWLGRLLPTSLAYAGGKVVLGRRIGYESGAVAASILYENLLMVSVAGLTSSVLLGLTLRETHAAPWWALALASGAVLLALPSARARQALAALSRRLRLDDSGHLQLNRRSGAAALALALAAMACNGLAFALLLSAFVDLDAREFITAGAAFNIAGAAGVAAVPVPSGIGVREAVLVGLLQTFVPLEVAAAAAALARFGSIPIDLALGAAGAAWLTARGTLRAQPTQPARLPLPERRAA